MVLWPAALSLLQAIEICNTGTQHVFKLDQQLVDLVSVTYGYGWQLYQKDWKQLAHVAERL